MKFCEKLIRLRKSRKMTQDEFARIIGVSRQAVYKWECGQSYPEALKLVAIKELFGISIDDMLDEGFEVQMPTRSAAHRHRTTTAPVKEEGTAPEQVFVTPAQQEAAEVLSEDIKEEKTEQTAVQKEPVINEVPKQAPQEEEEPKKKSGFFARLFGKK